MTKHQTAVTDKLQAIVTEARSLEIRLLIECELSGKLWIYCDAKDKRTVLRLIRKNRVMNRKRIFAEGYNTKFLNPHPSFVMREIDKGKVRKLDRVRPCVSKTLGSRHIWFYDLSNDQIDNLKSIISRLWSTDSIILEIENHFPSIIVNYSGSDLMFYGR